MTTVRISVSGTENLKISKLVNGPDGPVTEAENILTVTQRDAEYQLEPGKVLAIEAMQPLLEVHVNPDAQQNMTVTLKATPEVLSKVADMLAAEQAKVGLAPAPSPATSESADK